MAKILFREHSHNIRDIVTTGAEARRIKEFSGLLKAEFDVVSIGCRPTGRMHIGNLFVLAHAMRYLKENPRAMLAFDIMDLDFDLQRGKSFAPFTQMKSTPEFMVQAELAVQMFCERLTVDRSRIKLNFLSEKLDFPINGLPFSSLRQAFLHLFKDREATKALKFATGVSEGGRAFKPPISLICPNCCQSAAEYSVYNDHTHLFEAQCHTWNCEVNHYVSSLVSGVPFNIHYLVDPIRDLLEPGRVVHIFGGDYEVKFGNMRAPKYCGIAAATEISRIALDITKDGTAFFIAPLLVDGQGSKISKSVGNGANDGISLQEHLRTTIDKTLGLIDAFFTGTLQGFKLVSVP